MELRRTDIANEISCAPSQISYVLSTRFSNDKGYLVDNPDVAAYVDANLSAFLGSRANGAIAHFVIYGSNEGRLAYDTTAHLVDLGYVL